MRHKTKDARRYTDEQTTKTRRERDRRNERRAQREAKHGGRHA